MTTHPHQGRIDAQLAFLIEADKLKSVMRGTSLHDNSRREYTGEHSWHIALYAMVMAEHANRPVNVDRVIKMLLIHDLVEIDAGDVPIHSAAARDAATQEAEEQAAATRIFGLLPPDQASSFRALWDEFEAAETDDAVFAKSLDRVQPVVSNLEAGGASWIDYNVTLDQLESRVGAKVKRGAPAIWDALHTRISAWFATR
ncbi:HD domain-containing protein [Yoonia sp. 208BN28-4]|uniref:HD domain-containing protein n=1 Tax=Yoonia sp. 208BN28-4 TaxID=3126505 RepID=UPI0030A041FD